MAHNFRQTVCNFISRNARNIDFGAVPISAEIALIHGVWHMAAANPNPNPNPPPTNPNKRGVGAVAENAVPRGAAGTVHAICSKKTQCVIAVTANLCAGMQ